MSNYGKVIPDTPLAVDYWYIRKCPHIRLFFLSHMHSDHTTGLKSTWSNRPIYCSPISATLLKLKLQVKEQWIHPLELNEPHLLPLDDIGKEKMTVTLMNANHCPGAVMFLFEGYFGSILYTGDFRYTPSMLREPCLRTNITIDVLYLDNTNCDPNRTLPSKQRATQQIKEIIRSHPNYNVVIGLYSLGKESLLLDLAMEFKTWIEVSPERMETYTALELFDVFTTEAGAARFRVVDQSKIRLSTIKQWNIEHPTLAIVPTSKPLVSNHPNLYVVPYSDHSSYQELEDFVSALKPTSIVPIIGMCVPEGLSALLPAKKRHVFLVPESVRNYMMRQPMSQISSSTHVSLHRRRLQSLVPKGVIFESPVRRSKRSCEEECLEQEDSEEDMDTESSEKDSDCILIDTSKKFFHDSSRRCAGDIAVAESVPQHQHLRNCAPVDILVHTKACRKHAKITKSPFRSNEDIINKTVANENLHHLSRCEHGLSDDDSASQHSGQRIDQDDLDYESCSSSSSFSALQEEYVQETENILLKNLPFREEDVQTWGFLPQSVVQQFPLCPVYHANDNSSDS